VLHTLVGFLVPLIMVGMLTRFFGKSRSFREGLKAWKFALFAGFAFTLPYLLVAQTLGPEFPVHRRRSGRSRDRGDGGEARLPGAQGCVSVRGAQQVGARVDQPFPGPAGPGAHRSAITMFQALVPYIVVVALLVITRTVEPVTAFLRSPDMTLAWRGIFGTNINTSSQPLYLPGTVLLIASIVTYFLHKMYREKGAYARAWVQSGKTIVGASVALLFAVPMVQVFIQSGQASAYASMPLVLAEGVSAVSGSAWPMFSPIIGALGAFIAGSNTVSNMMFSLFQFATAVQIDLTANQAAFVVAPASRGRRRRQHDLRAQRGCCIRHGGAHRARGRPDPQGADPDDLLRAGSWCVGYGDHLCGDVLVCRMGRDRHRLPALHVLEQGPGTRRGLTLLRGPS
jgi:lactate permease